jgi:hypothetical protein
MRRWTGIILVLALAVPAVAPAETRSVRWLPGSPTVSTANGPDLSALEEAYSENPGELSVGKAVGYSLLLPGLGDWYAGNHPRAVVSFGIEAAIWTAFIVSKVQADQREDAFREYATIFAEVTSTGHSDDYYALLREYDNWELYEAEVMLDARIAGYDSGQNPDLGSDVLQQYFADNRVSDFEPWQWASLDHKVQFQEMRSSAKNADRRAEFLIAAAVANRVVASIFAYMAVKKANSTETASAQRYHIDFSPPRAGYDAAVSLTRRF